MIGACAPGARCRYDRYMSELTLYADSTWQSPWVFHVMVALEELKHPDGSAVGYIDPLAGTRHRTLAVLGHEIQMVRSPPADWISMLWDRGYLDRLFRLADGQPARHRQPVQDPFNPLPQCPLGAGAATDQPA